MNLMNREICLLGFLDKGKREKTGYYLFFAGIMLEILVMVTDNAANFTMPFRGRITHVAFALFLVKILLTKYQIKEWLALFGFGILGAISYLTCDDEYIIRIVAILFACKSVEIEKILKYILIITFVASLITVVLSFAGISGQIYETRDYGRGLVETRYMLGFSHANNLHDMLWFIFSLILLVYKKGINYIVYLTIFVVNIVFFYFTRSRTGFITIILLIAMALAVKYSEHYGQFVIKAMSISAFVVEMICVIGITIFASGHNIHNSRLVAILDVPLTGRLEMLSEYANIVYWEWFPGPRSAEKVDNGFAVINFSYGMIVSIVFVILIVLLFARLIRKENYYSVVLLMCSILVLFMESTFMINVSLLCNFVIILAMESIANNTNNRKIENAV